MHRSNTLAHRHHAAVMCSKLLVVCEVSARRVERGLRFIGYKYNNI
jgi:hypothetical protein